MSVIKGDLHYHSMHTACQNHWSIHDLIDYHTSCGAGAVVEMIRVGAFLHRLGYEYLALTNHPQFPMATQPASRHDVHVMLDHLRHIHRLNREHHARGIKFLAGVEANILNAQGQLGLSTAVLKKLDIVIASNHRSTHRLSRRQIKEGFINAAKNKHVDIIGHLTRFITKLRLNDWKDIVHACEQSGTVIEYNTNTPPAPSVLAFIAEHEVLVSLGSDTHPDMITMSLERYAGVITRQARAAIKHLHQAGVPHKRIINTFPLAKLHRFLKK